MGVPEQVNCEELVKFVGEEGAMYKPLNLHPNVKPALTFSGWDCAMCVDLMTFIRARHPPPEVPLMPSPAADTSPSPPQHVAAPSHRERNATPSHPIPAARHAYRSPSALLKSWPS